jgi:hypothetical protein
MKRISKFGSCKELFSAVPGPAVRSPSFLLNAHRRRLPQWQAPEADYSLISCAEVKNAWSYTSTHPCIFVACFVIKHEHNLFTDFVVSTTYISTVLEFYENAVILQRMLRNGGGSGSVAPTLLVQYWWDRLVFKNCALQIPAYVPLTETFVLFKCFRVKSDDTSFKQTSLQIILGPY